MGNPSEAPTARRASEPISWASGWPSGTTWAQLDTVSGLVSSRAAGRYQVEVCWDGGHTPQLTEERHGSLPAHSAQEECVVRQQLALEPLAGCRIVAIKVIKMTPAAEFVGHCKLDALDEGSQVLKDIMLENVACQPTGVRIKARLYILGGVSALKSAMRRAPAPRSQPRGPTGKVGGERRASAARRSAGRRQSAVPEHQVPSPDSLGPGSPSPSDGHGIVFSSENAQVASSRRSQAVVQDPAARADDRRQPKGFSVRGDDPEGPSTDFGRRASRRSSIRADDPGGSSAQRGATGSERRSSVAAIQEAPSVHRRASSARETHAAPAVQRRASAVAREQPAPRQSEPRGAAAAAAVAEPAEEPTPRQSIPAGDRDAESAQNARRSVRGRSSGSDDGSQSNSLLFDDDEEGGESEDPVSASDQGGDTDAYDGEEFGESGSALSASESG